MSGKPQAQPKPQPARSWWPAAFGIFLGLCFLKFGNPPIMEKWITPPSNAYEFVLGYPWPISWAYWLLLALCAWLFLLKRPSLAQASKWALLPAAWLGWQIVATAGSIDGYLSAATLKHFFACAGCFYLGYFGLREGNLLAFWVGLVIAFSLTLATGWSQHFGGLEASRTYFFTYIYPTLTDVAPEYLKKMKSDRIFATLFYPNALAGAVLLMLPMLLGLILALRDYFTDGARRLLIGLFSAAALGCLYWSGSKGGWLLLLFLGVLALLKIPFSRRLKWSLIAALAIVGLIGFAWKYAGFFQKGATSVSARFDYWHAAARTAGAHPILGTGPGTFAIPYQKIKKPESEMSRLVHNDYLEQATDSGLPGALLYVGMIVILLSRTFPRIGSDPLRVGAWFGLLGWALQGFMEFGLYIPALAWTAFAFMGWLLAREVHAVASGNLSGQ